LRTLTPNALTCKPLAIAAQQDAAIALQRRIPGLFYPAAGFYNDMSRSFSLGMRSGL
jgi:hypothetical protein